MTPGVDYAEWVPYGKTRPDPSCYSTFCKRCWGSQGLEPGSDDGVNAASDPEVMADAEMETDEEVKKTQEAHAERIACLA